MVLTSTKGNITITLELPTIKGNQYKWTIRYNGKDYNTSTDKLEFYYLDFKILFLRSKGIPPLPISNEASEAYYYQYKT